MRRIVSYLSCGPPWRAQTKAQVLRDSQADPQEVEGQNEVAAYEHDLAAAQLHASDLQQRTNDLDQANRCRIP